MRIVNLECPLVDDGEPVSKSGAVLKGVSGHISGLTTIPFEVNSADKANQLCREAVEALNCFDHVRVDMRFDAHANLKIIEVNGIPGLKPIKSWSPQMFTLYNKSSEGPLEDYRLLLHKIVDSAFTRYNLSL